MGRDRSFYITLLVLGVSQGASYPLIRVAVRQLSPAALMELRILFAVPVEDVTTSSEVFAPVVARNFSAPTTA